MMEVEARALFGSAFLGSDELSRVARVFTLGHVVAPAISFEEETLHACSASHLLLFAPPVHADGSPVTIKSLRNLFGVDPEVSQPCFYNQDWYLLEEFAGAPLDARWHLLAKEVMVSARGQDPEAIRSALRADQVFPTAAVCAFAFLAYWFVSGGCRLWSHDFLWCRDFDHQGDRIYVGRYEDPAGVNKPGFNIHRHLSLRSVHSAALERI